jgi:hypothetical protein
MSARLIGWVGAYFVNQCDPSRNANHQRRFRNWQSERLECQRQPADAPIIINYNGTSGLHHGAFGESVPAPTNGLTSGVYFFADTGAQSISQLLPTLTANTSYVLSFEVYAPQNGRANPFEASLFATLNGSMISKVFSAGSLTSGWEYYSTTFTPTSAAASYDFKLNFRGYGNGGAAADFVVDNVSIADNVSLATAIPEPHTWELLIAGFAGIGLVIYRQRSDRLSTDSSPGFLREVFRKMHRSARGHSAA